jgi:hypothetical protein
VELVARFLCGQQAREERWLGRLPIIDAPATSAKMDLAIELPQARWAR